MFFSIKDLELHKIPFDVKVQAGEIDYLEPRLRQLGPLETQGVAELIGGSLGDLRVAGHLSVRIESECDRCLERAEFGVAEDFDLSYRQAIGPVGRAGEIAVPEEESEIAYLVGDGLELNEVLREQVLLGLPMRKLCREECLGICPVCGGNRNLAACGCEAKPADDRWSALKNL